MDADAPYCVGKQSVAMAMLEHSHHRQTLCTYQSITLWFSFDKAIARNFRNADESFYSDVYSNCSMAYIRDIVYSSLYGNGCDGTLSFITIEAASLAGVLRGVA